MDALWGEHGLPPQLRAVPLGQPVGKWQPSKEQWEVFAISSLQSVRLWVSG